MQQQVNSTIPLVYSSWNQCTTATFSVCSQRCTQNSAVQCLRPPSAFATRAVFTTLPFLGYYVSSRNYKPFSFSSLLSTDLQGKTWRSYPHTPTPPLPSQNPLSLSRSVHGSATTAAWPPGVSHPVPPTGTSATRTRPAAPAPSTVSPPHLPPTQIAISLPSPYLPTSHYLPPLTLTLTLTINPLTPTPA